MDRDVKEEGDWTSWSKFLTINLRMKTSDVFKDAELTTEEEKGEEEEQEAKLKELKYPWHAEQGIVENISKLNEEFNEFRGLNPVKIFVTGPPASGKTFYSEKLASYYHIPRVHVTQLVDAALKLAKVEDGEEGEGDEAEFIVKVRETVTTLRDELKEKMEEARGDPPEDEEWPEIDAETLTVRLPNDILYKLLQDKLKENACRNRGYILDGFPRTYDDANECFLQPVIEFDEEGEPIEPEEVELEEGEKKDFSKHEKNQKIYPKSCILLTGSNNDLVNRVKELPEEDIAGTHYNNKDMTRRLKAYDVANKSEVAEPSVQAFFE